MVIKNSYWPGLFKIINTNSAYFDLDDFGFLQIMDQNEPYIVISNETKLNYIQASSFLNLTPFYFKREVAAQLSPEPEDGRWGKWRCLYKDLAAFREEEDLRRDEAMNELTAMDQEMGLYD